MIKLDTMKVLDLSNMVNNINQEQSNNFQDIQKVINNLENNWKSKSGNKLVNEMNQCKKMETERKIIFDNSRKFLHDNVGIGGENTNKENVNLAERFK